MDGSSNHPAGPDISSFRLSDRPLATEFAEDDDQLANSGNEIESFSQVDAESGPFGKAMLILLSPLLVTIVLLSGLWQLNMRMGNLNPPWYTMYMHAFRRWFAVAVEAFINAMFLLFDALLDLFDAVNEIFTRELLAKLFVAIPLFTMVLYGIGFFPAKCGVMAMIVVNDLIYFGIDVVARAVDGAEESRMAMFIFAEVVLGMGRVGLVERA